MVPGSCCATKGGYHLGALDPGSPGRASNGVATIELVPGDPFDTGDGLMPFLAGIFLQSS